MSKEKEKTITQGEPTIVDTQDGSHTMFSERFQVSYHSKYGAIQETRHVFIEAGLYAKISGAKSISVLEFGFGTGLNALMTLLEAEHRQLPIHYQTVEAFPISADKAEKLNYPSQLMLPEKKDVFLELHRCEWNVPAQITPYFTFTKHRTAFFEVNFEEVFDVVYYDAFAPTSQPELWEPDILAKPFNALRKEGIFVTYCAKGQVKRHLKSLGFRVEALPGPPGKREMTRAIKE